MKKKCIRKIAVAVMLGLMAPLAAQASDADLQMKIDKLSKEVNDLKGSVKKVEDKSLGKWLSVGGEYRFRVDSLRGDTVPYSSAINTMGTMVGGFLNDPSVANGTTNPSPLSYMMAGTNGTLFTQKQFDMILNSYMPQAMYGVQLLKK